MEEGKWGAPFWTRSWAAVTFFFLIPAAASAFASCCCFCFCSGREKRVSQAVGVFADFVSPVGARKGEDIERLCLP